MIDLLGLVASTFFQEGPPNAKFDIAGHVTLVILVDKHAASNNSPFLCIVLEIVLALQRFVDSEMVSYNLCTISSVIFPRVNMSFSVSISSNDRYLGLETCVQQNGSR